MALEDFYTFKHINPKAIFYAKVLTASLIPGRTPQRPKL